MTARILNPLPTFATYASPGTFLLNERAVKVRKADMIFDTDVLIWASRGNPNAARTINKATERGLSVVSFMELLQGARSKLEIGKIQQSLLELQFSILPLSESIGATAVTLIEQHALAHGIQVADALIAATAIVLSRRLCTANTKHFQPIRGLSLVSFHP